MRRIDDEYWGRPHLHLVPGQDETTAKLVIDEMTGLEILLFGCADRELALLSYLGLRPEDVGRYRGCYLSCGDGDDAVARGEMRIVVHTRNGGGNRRRHEHVSRALRAHPSYLTDYDDDFDCTYANYEFLIPDLQVVELRNLCGVATDIEIQQLLNQITDTRDDA